MELAIQRIAWAVMDGIVIANRAGLPTHVHMMGEPFWDAFPDDRTLGSLGYVRCSEWTNLGSYWRCVVS